VACGVGCLDIGRRLGVDEFLCILVYIYQATGGVGVQAEKDAP